MKKFIIYKIGNETFNLYPLININQNLIDCDIPSGAEYRIIEDDLRERSFRRCYKPDWTLPNGSISTLTLDISLAKEVFIDNLRITREPLFAPLDVQYMRALEQGNTDLMQSIAQQKQILRDITQMDLSSATDLVSLKQLWPTSILGDSPF